MPGTAAQLTARVLNQNAFSSPRRIFDAFRSSMNQPLVCTPMLTRSGPLAFVRVANFRLPYDDTKRSATHLRVYLLRQSEHVYQSCSFEISVLFSTPFCAALHTILVQHCIRSGLRALPQVTGTSGVKPRQTNSSPIGGREEARGPYNFE